jgi:predicted TIM-barrel fold metal-dependent hydrolase
VTSEHGAVLATPLRIIDTDIHHDYHDKVDLYPYLSQTYRERLRDYGFGGDGGLYANNGGVLGRRGDTLDPDDPEDKTTAAKNVGNAIKILLDGAGVDRGILTGSSINGASSMTDLDYASALCRAFNDYSIDHWLQADLRFRLAIAVCAQDPQSAAAEIDRIGDHPGVVSIILPCGTIRAYGHRFYRPIHEACARHGLAIALHFNGEGSGINGAPTAAGYPSYYIESRQARPSFYQAHLASFVFEGVFERFPTLKVAMLESAFGWIPAYLWRMDSDWKGLRYQTPWVNHLPSEYVVEHVRFASQPMDEPETPEDLRTVIRWMHGERTLMFATDYPHWDWDDPAQSFTTLPPDLRHRIFVENALDAFPKLRTM